MGADPDLLCFFGFVFPFSPPLPYGEDVSLVNEFASGDRVQDRGRWWDTGPLTRSWGDLLIGSVRGKPCPPSCPLTRANGSVFWGLQTCSSNNSSRLTGPRTLIYSASHLILLPGSCTSSLSPPLYLFEFVSQSFCLTPSTPTSSHQNIHLPISLTIFLLLCQSLHFLSLSQALSFSYFGLFSQLTRNS